MKIDFCGVNELSAGGIAVFILRSGCDLSSAFDALGEPDAKEVGEYFVSSCFNGEDGSVERFYHNGRCIICLGVGDKDIDALQGNKVGKSIYNSVTSARVGGAAYVAFGKGTEPSWCVAMSIACAVAECDFSGMGYKKSKSNGGSDGKVDLVSFASISELCNIAKSKGY